MLVPIERVLRSTVVIAFRVANGLITDIHFRREDGIGILLTSVSEFIRRFL